MVSEFSRDRPLPLWKGYRLYAGDGSTIGLPPSISVKADFGVESITDQGTERSLARIFMMYSVMDRFVHDSELGPMSNGEKTMLTDSLERMPLEENAVLLLDRGFGNICVVKELHSRGIDFCIRISGTMSNFAKAAMKNPKNDYTTDWSPSEKSKENLRKNGQDCNPMTVRVTKVVLDSGETELLVSSLNETDKVSLNDLADLYHLRWGVEEGFKNLKPKMKLGYFGSGKSPGILQEFYAHIFCMNMVALAGSTAQTVINKKTGSRKLGYTYNWKNAYRIIRERMADFLFLSSMKAAKLLDEICALISSSLIAVKPGRKYPREIKNNKLTTRLYPVNK
jgi:hypothetical protein